MSIFYKYGKVLTHSDNAKFDAQYHPGTATPNSGIYICVNCGKECTSVYGHPLPPQNHHQHSDGSRILWQLAVWG